MANFILKRVVLFLTRLKIFLFQYIIKYVNPQPPNATYMGFSILVLAIF